MKILSKLDNTRMIEETADKRFVTDAEKLKWNGKADKTYVDSQDALKADKTYVDSKVQTDVPAGAKFTDTVYTHPSTHLTTMLREPEYVKGSIPLTARNSFDVLRGDRLAFLPPEQIIIENSIDGGITWTDAKVNDSTKKRLFSGARPSISIPLVNGVKSTKGMTRLTITGMRYDVPEGTPETKKYEYWNSEYIKSTERYLALEHLWIWMSTNSDSVYLKVESANGANPDSWRHDGEAYLSGWSGGNYVKLSGTTFGGGVTQTTNMWNRRFTFQTCSNSHSFDDKDLSKTYTSSAQSFHHIKGSGNNIWILPNNYANHEHMYSWDEDQNVSFPANVTAPNFIGNASTVNGKTVLSDVPANAKFTDTNTTYTEITTAEIDAGTASTSRTITGRRVKYILDKISSMISVAIGALTKSSVGLGNVDNTSDASKPISTATQTALNGKVNNSQVLTNVPSGAKFTDTITTINGKTGAIAKDDIVALGIPAPEDVSQEIADIVGNAVGDVMEVVTTNYATISLVNNAITNEVTAREELDGELREEITSQVQQSATSFDIVFNKLENGQNLNKEEIELIQSYFRIDADTGVVIGKSGSQIEFFAENARVGIRENGTDIAYWEGGTMHVDKLIAVVTIMIGYHVIEKYESTVAGNTTIVRIGDN